MRENVGAGQEIGNRYAPPVRDAKTRRQGDAEIFPQDEFESWQRHMTRIAEVAAIMRCPRCKAEGQSLKDGAVVCPACKARMPVDGSNIVIDYEAAELPEAPD